MPILLKRALIGGLGIAMMALVAACSGETPTAGSGPAAGSSASAAPKIFTVGQTMTNGAKQTVTVLGFKRGVPPGQYMTATAGEEGVQVSVALVNGDSTTWSLPLYGLTAVDASGQSHNANAFTYGTDTSIDALVPGGKATGTMFFAVPQGSALNLTWTPSLFNSNSTYQTALK